MNIAHNTTAIPLKEREGKNFQDHFEDKICARRINQSVKYPSCERERKREIGTWAQEAVQRVRLINPSAASSLCTLDMGVGTRGRRYTSGRGRRSWRDGRQKTRRQRGLGDGLREEDESGDPHVFTGTHMIKRAEKRGRDTRTQGGIYGDYEHAGADKEVVGIARVFNVTFGTEGRWCCHQGMLLAPMKCPCLGIRHRKCTTRPREAPPKGCPENKLF
ncbi:hypothetical protein B0H11DRAFT_2322583 [Mycena galericulata]|nr:hypothetical protein B0H11DRAFT_2322583 [Mycena galericulata]